MFELVNSFYGETGTFVKSEEEFRKLMKQCGFPVPELTGQFIENIEGYEVYTLCDPDGEPLLEEFHKAPYGCKVATALLTTTGLVKEILHRCKSTEKVLNLYKKDREEAQHSLSHQYSHIVTWEKYVGCYLYHEEAQELEEEN